MHQQTLNNSSLQNAKLLERTTRTIPIQRREQSYDKRGKKKTFLSLNSYIIAIKELPPDNPKRS